MKKIIHTDKRIAWLLCLLVLVNGGCKSKQVPETGMERLLRLTEQKDHVAANIYCPEAVMDYCDSILDHSAEEALREKALYLRAGVYLQLGEEQQAIDAYQALLNNLSPAEIDRRQFLLKELALSYLRLGERNNCILNHNAESCIYPLSAGGVHADKTGSRKAIELYKTILAEDPTDLESRWLLNIAYMTTGEYPASVPKNLLLKSPEMDSAGQVRPFRDVAANLGLDFKSMGGGSIIEDFNNDGWPDMISSGWGLKERIHYSRNNGDGTFTDVSDSSGLGYLAGGLNMMQTDYNNDGWKDIFVLRGAWKGKYGKDPNSLLRNNGDGTFTDVTKEAGLLSFHPTQTAVWADFNRDGWLDLFIGNETSDTTDPQPCELYINNGKGHFTNQAPQAGCAVTAFVKGVTAGDYDNDGRPDIFISTLNGQRVLLHNRFENGQLKFEDLTAEAGLTVNPARSFATWFWDYDNDGWPDILQCGYEFYDPLASYAAAEAIGAPVGNAGKIFLFHNDHKGHFREMSAAAGLTGIVFAMSANFGDIDNDGYLDFYTGTGNPKFKSLLPNKLFKNEGGNHFVDITGPARVGSLQKGHGISFADMDNDGYEDIYIEMGGAFPGDAYENALYLNPGEDDNNWVEISLEGIKSNRAAIGARIKLVFTEKGKERTVFRDVNSGGSFGSSPLQQHIGIGKATSVDRLEITWPATGTTQVFSHIPVNTHLKIKEGATYYITYSLPRLDLLSVRSGLIPCRPSR